MIIFGSFVWFANGLLLRAPALIAERTGFRVKRALIGTGVLLGVQIFWGGLVEGLKAGLSFAPFPLMDCGLLPPGGWKLDPVWLNFVENSATVQWTHRLLATFLLVAVIGIFTLVWRSPALTPFRGWSASLLGVIVLQYGLGIATLLSHVVIGLAITHQLVALLAVFVLLTFLHRVTHSGPATADRLAAP